MTSIEVNRMPIIENPVIFGDFTLIEITVHILKGLVLVIGGIITYYAYRAYAMQRDKSLFYLTIGFGLITIGAILGGITIVLTNRDFLMALLLDSSFTLAGLSLILYSLHVTTTETYKMPSETNLQFVTEESPKH